MGYRNFLASIPKHVHEEIHTLTEKEVVDKLYDLGEDYDEDDGFSFYDIPEFDKFYSLGKWCDFDIGNNIEPFFKEPMSWDGDCEFNLANEKVFLSIIESYRTDILKYYNQLSDGDVDSLRVFVNDKRTKWENYLGIKPYNLDKTRETLVSSWDKEYAIFELVRLYKNFDWKNNVLVYGGS